MKKKFPAKIPNTRKLGEAGKLKGFFSLFSIFGSVKNNNNNNVMLRTRLHNELHAFDMPVDWVSSLFITLLQADEVIYFSWLDEEKL